MSHDVTLASHSSIDSEKQRKDARKELKTRLESDSATRLSMALPPRVLTKEMEKESVSQCRVA